MKARTTIEGELEDKDIILEEEFTWEEESDLLKIIFTSVSRTVMLKEAQGNILSFAFGSNVKTVIDEQMKEALGPLGVFVGDDSPRDFPYNVSFMFDMSTDAHNIVHFCVAIAQTIAVYKSRWFWLRCAVIDSVENFYAELAATGDDNDD